MDHAYIDEQAVPERYVKLRLAPAERAAFEAHLVDCQECVDRLLLAEIFHGRNGIRATAPFREPGTIIDVNPDGPQETAHFEWRSIATFFALATLLAGLVCTLVVAMWPHS